VPRRVEMLHSTLLLLPLLCTAGAEVSYIGHPPHGSILLHDHPDNVAHYSAPHTPEYAAPVYLGLHPAPEYSSLHPNNDGLHHASNQVEGLHDVQFGFSPLKTHKAKHYEAPHNYLAPCLPRTLYETKIEKVPVVSTVYKSKYIHDTSYKTIVDTEYKTNIVTEYHPQFFTETKFVNNYHTLTKHVTKYITDYKTHYKTETKFKPSYVTTTAYVTDVETRYQPQYITETKVTPVSKTQIVTKTEVIHETKYIDQHEAYKPIQDKIREGTGFFDVYKKPQPHHNAYNEVHKELALKTSHHEYPVYNKYDHHNTDYYGGHGGHRRHDGHTHSEDEKVEPRYSLKDFSPEPIYHGDLTHRKSSHHHVSDSSDKFNSPKDENSEAVFYHDDDESSSPYTHEGPISGPYSVKGAAMTPYDDEANVEGPQYHKVTYENPRQHVYGDDIDVNHKVTYEDPRQHVYGDDIDVTVSDTIEMSSSPKTGYHYQSKYDTDDRYATGRQSSFARRSDSDSQYESDLPSFSSENIFEIHNKIKKRML